MFEDFDRCYRAVHSKDRRFDGWFVTAVTSTGIYCRPSCPAMTPKSTNVRFYPTAAAAQIAGFRACKRCRPDASPGSPEWNSRADVVGRAMRLIADGVVDREGVAGLARRLGYSERHLNRQLTAEVGAGPIALARAQRAQTSRILIETTDLPFTEVAFAAGFASIRQFNDTVRAIFATSPTGLRAKRGRPGGAEAGAINLRLPYREPFDGTAVLEFLGRRAVAGIESGDDGVYRRSLDLPRAAGVMELAPAAGHVACVLWLDDIRDLAAAVERARRLLDLDADPEAVDEVLGADPLLAPWVAKSPGRRVPGSVDGAELALRAVLGQQVSLPVARSLAARLVAALGQPLKRPIGSVTYCWPAPELIAESDLSFLGMPAKRRQTLRALAWELSSGVLVIDPGVDREMSTDQLMRLPGIGVWTAQYVAMRALSDPDAFLPSDLGVRHALARLGQRGDLASAGRIAERWRPWRAYALQYLWSVLDERSAPPPR